MGAYGEGGTWTEALNRNDHNTTSYLATIAAAGAVVVTAGVGLERYGQGLVTEVADVTAAVTALPNELLIDPAASMAQSLEELMQTGQEYAFQGFRPGS